MSIILPENFDPILDIKLRAWPTQGAFRIARGAVTTVDMLYLRLSFDGVSGHAETRIYDRYGDDFHTMRAQIVEAFKTPQHPRQSLAGAAANVVDCALMDWWCRYKSIRAADVLGCKPKPLTTAFTISVDHPLTMAKAAQIARQYPLLKVKIGAEHPLDCVRAVAQARADAALIIDGNEALTSNQLEVLVTGVSDLNIRMIEQPLPQGQDHNLPDSGPPICADESLHTAADLPRLRETGYRAVNVKLDKVGGVTPALDLMRSAKAQGFEIMAGCMAGTSLSIAPMVTIAALADVVDLDGPLLLAKDCDHPIKYEGATIYPPNQALWG